MKRFYESATYQTCDGDHLITLDGKPLTTQLKYPVKVPNETLAHIICEEWNAQGETIVPASMPLYSILVTAIDKAQHERESITNGIREYIDGDLLFYRAPEPIKLVEIQKPLWDDAMQKAEEFFRCTCTTTYDLTAIQQSQNYHMAINAYIESLDMYQFTVFHILVSVTGSPILATLGVKGILTSDHIINIIQCEDQFYAALYGSTDDDSPKDQKEKIILIQSDIKNSLSFSSHL